MSPEQNPQGTPYPPGQEGWQQLHGELQENPDAIDPRLHEYAAAQFAEHGIDPAEVDAAPVHDALGDIGAVESAVTSGLGLENEPPSVVLAETADAVTHVAEESIGSHAPNEGQAVLDAAVAGVTIGEPGPNNPIDTLVRDGHEDELVDAVKTLAAEGAYGTAEAVAHEIDAAESEQGYDILDRVSQKAEAAIERSEFKGPEVSEAIKGFYLDHEVAFDVVKSVVQNDVPTVKQWAQRAEQGDIGITNEYLKVATEKLLQYRLAEVSATDPETQRRLQDAGKTVARGLVRAVYTEVSAGLVAMSDQELADVAQNKTDLLRKLGDGLSTLDESQLHLMRNARQYARNEIRPAGQLLFHNTAFGGDVMRSTALAGRKRQQIANDGQFNATTAASHGFTNHSAVVHFSEQYDPWSYKHGEVELNATGARVMAATYAVPLGAVIGKAPFARGVHYAVLEAVHPDVEQAAVTIHNQKLVGDIGPGAPDGVGSDSFSIDRTFWADTQDRTKAADYEIPVAGRRIMMYDEHLGREVATTYLIQSDADKRRSAPTVPGAGYGYPSRVDIPTAHDHGVPIWRSESEPYIKKIQEESVARFKGQYVVPLRATSEHLVRGVDSADNHVYGTFGDALDKELHEAHLQAEGLGRYA